MVPNLSPRQIIAAMCEGTGITPDEVCGQSRQRRIVEVRYRTIRVMRAMKRWSCPQLGRHLGGRDHTSIVHACRRADRPLGALAMPKRPETPPPRVEISAKPPPSAPLPRIVITAVPPADPDDIGEPEFTRLQAACRAATDRLLSEHGPALYAPWNVRGERPQLAPPPFG